MKKIILITLLLSINNSYAQNSIVANGNTLINSYGSVSYSMGQVNQLNVETSTAFISEGVQQPFEIVEHLGLTNLEFQNSFSLYPNPATSKVFLQFSDEIETPVFLTLRDLSGRIIESKELIESISELTISQLPTAIYYLTITSNHTTSTITLIKN